MKYIISESQYNLLTESSTLLWVKRRVTYESMKKYISDGEINYPTLCDEFGDEFEYADSVIKWAVDDFLSSNEDVILDDMYDEVYEIVVDKCKDWFGEYLFEIYRETCSEEYGYGLNEQNDSGKSDLIGKFLNSKNFIRWDEQDEEFDVSDGNDGNGIIKYRIQHSSIVPDHFFEVIYIHDSIIESVSRFFGIPDEDSVKAIINWFNKKYDKSLTVENYEWLGGDTYYADDDEND